MDLGLVGTIARLTNTRPNWDREVTRAVGAARACAVAALIRALGVEVEYADLRGIELSHAKPDLPDRPLEGHERHRARSPQRQTHLRASKHTGRSASWSSSSTFR